MTSLHHRYQTAMDEVFQEFISPDPHLPAIVAAACLLRNGTVLLTGTYGCGKNTLVEALAKRLFVDDSQTSYQRIACHQELMDTDVLYRVDFRTEDIQPRGLLSCRFRYLNELPRSNPSLQNALLAFFAEGQVCFRDRIFPVADGLTFFDRNPFDVGSEGVVNALLDRIDVEIVVPALDRLDLRPREATVTTLDTREMIALWQRIEQVELAFESRQYAAMIHRYFSVCVKDRGSANRLFHLPCDSCGYRGEICRRLRETPGLRGLLTMQRLAKALAWYHGRERVDIFDLEAVVPYVYSHRLDFHHEVFTEWPNPQRFLREYLLDGQLEAKRRRWLEAIDHKEKDDLDALKRLAGQTGDLVIAWLYQQALRQMQPLALVG